MRLPFAETFNATSARSRTALALVAIVLVAAGLRFAALDTQPWGLHADELGPSLSGLDALHGRLPFRLPDYDIWLHALAFAVLGASPVAMRVLPALAGSLLPLSTFLALHGLFGRRVALLAAALTALAIWPLALSRSGFSISYLPVMLGLTLWQVVAAWQTGRARHWVLAGVLLAATQYIYFPARALLLILGAAAVYVLVVGPRRRLWQAWPSLPAFLLGILPLYWQTSQLETETTRYNTVFILAPQNDGGQPLAAIARQVWLGLSMFFYQGDANYRHNVPPHPVYDLFILPLALIGLVLLLRAWRRPRTLFWLAWMGAMLAPMLLSIESPHFLRAAGILPLVFVPPALGMDYLWQKAEQRGWQRLGLTAITLLLGASLLNTVYAYFGSAYRDSRLLYYAFAGQDTDLAVDINRFLGAGWQGQGWLAKSTTPEPGRAVWIDPQLWTDLDRQRALRILVPPEIDTTSAFRFVNTASPGLDAGVTDMQLVLVPGQEQPAVSLLPHNRLIRVRDGPLPSWQPPGVQPIYRLFTTESPAALPARPLACFTEGIELLKVETVPSAADIAVNLYWRATTRPSFDFTVFVHVVAQETIAGQVDEYPLAGRYLTSWWRPGDIIADEHTVKIPAGTDLTGAYLRVGLYRWDTVVDLPATDCAGGPPGNFVTIPLARGP